MKILVVTSRLPFPPKGGDRLRVFNFIKLLSKRHEIYLISFIESKEEERYVEDLENYCKKVETILLSPLKSYLNCLLYFFTPRPLQVSYYQNKKMHSKVRSFIKKYNIDSVYAHLIRSAPYVKDLKLFKVLDLTDAISLSLKRSLAYRRHFFYLFYFLEYLRVRRYERKIIKHFDKCILISDMDRDAIGKDLANVEIIQNGVDLDSLKPSNRAYDDKKIAFVGNLHSFPNRDAVLFFYHEILPYLKKEIPDIKFYIIGINPPQKILNLDKDKNVVVTGPVVDIRQYLSNAACFVSPIRSGAGLQNKILEAMSLGLPVVTTSIAFEGIKVRREEDLLVRDNPKEFAQAVLNIMKDKDLRTKLSKNARAAVEENYNWQLVEKDLEKNIFLVIKK